MDLGAVAYISLSSCFGFNCLFLYVLMVLVWVAGFFFFFFFDERHGHIWGWGFLREKRGRVIVRWTELKGALVKHRFLYKILYKCKDVLLLWHDIITRFLLKFCLTQWYNKAPKKFRATGIWHKKSMISVQTKFNNISEIKLNLYVLSKAHIYIDF